jgi:ABC-2 type transport system ATP-binding protein
MLSGILYPDAGKIAVLGLSPQKDRKALSYRIGTVFGQKPQLWFHLPPIDSFNLFAKIYEIDTQKYKLRIEELVKRFNISEIINQPVRKLSLGQRMRCEIVLSLIHRPEILFLDEPTIGLDISAKKTIREIIREINEKEDTTVILTSHDMDDVEKICKRAIIINNGIIVYDGKIKDLKNKHMKMKKIKVLSETPLRLPNVSGMKIVKQKKYGATIEINTKVSPIKTVINSIIAKNKIIDLIIESPPIEEIIEEIYNRKII